MCIRDRDEHGQAECGGEGVLEQLEAGVARRERLGRDARSDDERREKRAADELGAGPADHVVTRRRESASREPGTSA